MKSILTVLALVFFITASISSCKKDDAKTNPKTTGHLTVKFAVQGYQSTDSLAINLYDATSQTRLTYKITENNHTADFGELNPSSYYIQSDLVGSPSSTSISYHCSQCYSAPFTITANVDKEVDITQ